MDGFLSKKKKKKKKCLKIQKEFFFFFLPYPALRPLASVLFIDCSTLGISLIMLVRCSGEHALLALLHARVMCLFIQVTPGDLCCPHSSVFVVFLSSVGCPDFTKPDTHNDTVGEGGRGSAACDFTPRVPRRCAPASPRRASSDAGTSSSGSARTRAHCSCVATCKFEDVHRWRAHA